MSWLGASPWTRCSMAARTPLLRPCWTCCQLGASWVRLRWHLQVHYTLPGILSVLHVVCIVSPTIGWLAPGLAWLAGTTDNSVDTQCLCATDASVRGA